MLNVKDLRIRLKQAKGTEERPLVEALSFEIPEGRSLTLLGQSGCGKTMTCRAVMDLLDPRVFSVSGEIRFGNRDLTALSEKEKRRLYGREIAFVPQNPMTALDPSMRIGRQMEETLKIHTADDAARRAGRIAAALRKAGLEEPDRILRSYPHMLSGGMLQRVLIAMAMMTDAKLVIADEPTTALDLVHRNEILDEFILLRESGAAVLVVTHDFAAALRLGGDLLVMQNGRAVESGDARAVYDAPRQEYTKALVEASRLSKGTAYAGGSAGIQDL